MEDLHAVDLQVEDPHAVVEEQLDSFSILQNHAGSHLGSLGIICPPPPSLEALIYWYILEVYAALADGDSLPIPPCMTEILRRYRCWTRWP